jgi:hypothetical protein
MSHVPYSSEVGSLMCAMVSITPNIVHALGGLRRYMSKERKDHWKTIKRVFKYLCDTTTYGLCYQGKPGLDKVLDIHGFIDAN